MKDTKKITGMGMLVAVAFIITLVSKLFPPMFAAFPFLNYDAKDVVVVISGFTYGPIAALMISVVVSVIEMFTVSETNIIGCIMNIISTCAFACTASAIYKASRTLRGGCAGLIAGILCCVATMMVLNYLLTPIYTGIPRNVVATLLVPAILPFNSIKCALNAAFTLIFYKPLARILKRAGFVESDKSESKLKISLSIVITAFVVIAMCAAAVYIIN